MLKGIKIKGEMENYPYSQFSQPITERVYPDSGDTTNIIVSMSFVPPQESTFMFKNPTSLARTTTLLDLERGTSA